MSDDRNMAGVKTKVGQCTVWTGRHCPDNRDLVMTGSGAGTLSLYQYQYPEKRTRVDKDGKKTGVAGKVISLQAQQVPFIQVHIVYESCHCR